MQFANILTGEIRNILSSTLVKADLTIQGASLEQWAELGWRRVVEVAEPAAGHRVTSYTPEEIDGLTCRLIVATQVNIADEQAAQLAESKTAAKTLAEVGATDTGLVLRALATLLLGEINTLRQRASLTQYTSQQFLNALKAKIDELQ